MCGVKPVDKSYSWTVEVGGFEPTFPFNHRVLFFLLLHLCGSVLVARRLFAYA